MVASDQVAQRPAEVAQQLLGFAAREMWLAGWPATRQGAALYKLDVVKPLSVDEMVWPSVFEVDRNLKRPKWTGYVQDLWANLARLKETLQAGWCENPRPSCLIAVTRVKGGSGPAQEAAWRNRVDSFNPPALSKEWRPLGFDVADTFLQSGLTNGRFLEDDDVPALRAAWGPLLNGWHLFKKMSDAAKFQKMADSRMPEHSPFFIYTLWLIQAIEVRALVD
ncbi:MAG TPA: hypothetical protein VMW75_27945 [Thermoanaerobaculia bacterium]|nr:hypothetical protein [Thermoanaerobaculia bacterium]